MTESQHERVVNLIMAWIDMQMKGGIEVLKAGMSAEELATIPFWQQQGARFACPYRANGQ